MRRGDFSELSAPLNDPSTIRSDPNRCPGQTLRDPFPGNIIPQNRLAKESLYYLPFYPLANTPGGTFNFAPSRMNTTDKFDLRGDPPFLVARFDNEFLLLQPIRYLHAGQFRRQWRRSFGCSQTAGRPVGRCTCSLRPRSTNSG